MISINKSNAKLTRYSEKCRIPQRPSFFVKSFYKKFIYRDFFVEEIDDDKKYRNNKREC